MGLLVLSDYQFDYARKSGPLRGQVVLLLTHEDVSLSSILTQKHIYLHRQFAHHFVAFSPYLMFLFYLAYIKDCEVRQTHIHTFLSSKMLTQEQIDCVCLLLLLIIIMKYLL
jgi:hypothetical protein